MKSNSLRKRGKYAQVAQRSYDLMQAGADAAAAWVTAATELFPNSYSARSKVCPRSTFMSLSSGGHLRNIAASGTTKASINRSHALEAIRQLQIDPMLAENANELWKTINCGSHKQHNQQMDVVLGLWDERRLAFQG